MRGGASTPYRSVAAATAAATAPESSTAGHNDRPARPLPAHVSLRSQPALPARRPGQAPAIRVPNHPVGQPPRRAAAAPLPARRGPGSGRARRSAALSGGIELRMRRFSGGKATPALAEVSSMMSRRSAAAAIRVTNRRSSACSSSSTASRPAACRTALSMPVASFPARSAARCESGSHPRSQADGALATSAWSASVRRSSSPSPSSASISSDTITAWARDRVVVPGAAAPAAGVGQHMGQRLEVDAGGGDVLRVVGPGERPVGSGFPGHAVSPDSGDSEWPVEAGDASPARQSMASTVESPSAFSRSTAAKAGPREENSATDQASSTRRATRQPSGPCKHQFGVSARRRW